MALGSAVPGPPRGDAHDRDVDRHHPVRCAAGWRIRVRRVPGRLELPCLHGAACYHAPSGDADYLGSGCPNGRALDDIDTATELGRFSDSRTGDHTGTNGATGSDCVAGALGDPERDTRTEPNAHSFGRAVAQRDSGTDPLTHAHTRAVADGKTTANTATVGRAHAIAVTAGRAMRVLPFRISGRQQRTE